MKKYLKPIIKIASFIVIIWIVFEIGWINGAKYMQIEANYGGASAAYCNLIILEHEPNAKYIIAKNGLDCQKVGDELNNSYYILGLFVKCIFDSHKVNESTRKSVKEYLIEIERSAQQGDAPEPATNDIPASQQSIPPAR